MRRFNVKFIFPTSNRHRARPPSHHTGNIMNPHALEQSSNVIGNDWAVILAGGDGTRLKSLTRHIAGDERPKQFCPVLDRGTLLEETQRRAAVALPAERTLYVVNRVHEFYYAPILADIAPDNIVEQPSNRGTAPAILYSLLRIAARDPKALVVFLPSDHFISDNQKFMAQVRAAFATARARPDLVVLLGLEPESPEVEYGWIKPGRPIRGHSKVFCVRRFWEKPNKMLAQVLQLRLPLEQFRDGRCRAHAARDA
jgi:mannose-1-phosphate guanylyltransferase